MKGAQAVLATSNAGKIRELSAALGRLGTRTLHLGDFPEIPAVSESGATFEENALLKAASACEATGLVAIADDSGLVVPALNGAPGIFSSRYAEDWPLLENESPDERNIRKLLANLADEDRREAYFETCLAVVAPNGRRLTARGRWPGEILRAPVGENGFGYDPVFYDPVLKKSAAELTLAEKNAISHRGRAVRALVAQWPAFIKTVY